MPRNNIGSRQHVRVPRRIHRVHRRGSIPFAGLHLGCRKDEILRIGRGHSPGGRFWRGIAGWHVVAVEFLAIPNDYRSINATNPANEFGEIRDFIEDNRDVRRRSLLGGHANYARGVWSFPTCPSNPTPGRLQKEVTPEFTMWVQVGPRAGGDYDSALFIAERHANPSTFGNLNTRVRGAWYSSKHFDPGGIQLAVLRNADVTLGPRLALVEDGYSKSWLYFERSVGWPYMGRPASHPKGWLSPSKPLLFDIYMKDFVRIHPWGNRGKEYAKNVLYHHELSPELFPEFNFYGALIFTFIRSVNHFPFITTDRIIRSEVQ